MRRLGVVRGGLHICVCVCLCAHGILQETSSGLFLSSVVGVCRVGSVGEQWC